MNLGREFALAAILLGRATTGQAQEAASDPASSKFEAASIKPSKVAARLFGVGVRGARLTARGVNMLGLITDAYQIQRYQISGDPKWFDSDGFDIEAVAGSIPTRDEFRRLLQALLADRFKLKFHRETREISILGLVLAKKDPKFHERKDGPGIEAKRPGAGHLRFRNLSDVAAGLSIYSSDRPVLDKTGLTGDYDLQVDWSTPPGEPRPDSTTAGDRLREAVLDQLGLKLVPMKASIEMFVIDYVEKPTAN